MDLSQYFVSLATIVPLAVLITEFLKLKLKIEKNWAKQVTAWVISVVLCLFGMWLNLGILSHVTFVQAVAYGIATGLVANGIFDLSIVQTLLNLLLGFLKPKE